MTRRIVVAAVAAVCIAAAPPMAQAAPPTLLSVSQQGRHPQARFSAPMADGVTVYVAKASARATDGSFLSENVKTLDILTSSEIQSGAWTSEDALDPGSYYVAIRASADFSACWTPEGGTNPSCADGYSATLALTIPRPTTRYTTNVQRYAFLGQISLSLVAKPLDEKQRYQVCYRTRAGKRKCVKGSLNGFDWDAEVSDQLTVSLRSLARRTTFTWYAGSSTTRRLTSRTVRTR